MNISNIYFIHQVMTIAMIYISGLIFMLLTDASRDKQNTVPFIMKALLAYPAGLSLWGVIGFIVLVLGIPYNAGVLVCVHSALCITLLFNYTIRLKQRIGADILKKCCIAVAAAVIAAILCCEGFITVSVSNDSYYYYSVYPQTIVLEGGYSTSFDVFLTDVGQTCAIIGTLPFLFGFEETYGIMLSLGINLIFIFAYAVYDVSCNKWKLSKACARFAAVLSTIFLVSSTPFIVMTKWVLANAYFMALCFVLFYAAYSFAIHKEKMQLAPFAALLTAMVSMLRMEGGMMAGLLILCMCILPIEGMWLMKYAAIPVAITQLLYYAVIYLKLTVNPLYSFLDFKNALIMLLFAAGLVLYTGFIRKRLGNIIKNYYSYLLLFLLIAGNALLLIIDSERYITNLKYLIFNIYNKTGWGMFGYIMAICFFLIFAVKMLKAFKIGKIKDLKPGYSLAFFSGFVLFTLAVCFARDGSLRLGIGDSGNRVLMQVVPFAIFALIEEVISYLQPETESTRTL